MSSSQPTNLCTQHSDEELLVMAGNADAIGKTGRNPNGTLTDYYKWARNHPQKDLNVAIQGKSDFGTLPRQGKLVVISWNLLSDTWYRKEKASDQYGHTRDEHGAWEFRLPRMLEWFRSLDADVITLQEVDYDLFESQIEQAMREIGYDGLVQKIKKKAKKQPCGNATFWKSSVLQLESSSAFSRSLATVLKYVNDNNRLCVINIHLESSQSQQGADRRARQLKSPLEWASRCVKGNLPLVLSGDCNTGADAALFTVVRNYQWHGHDLASAYEHPSAENSMPARHATFCVPGHHYLIDQLWYSHDLLKSERLLEPLSTEEREKVLVEGLPNEVCPSDHVPIGAVFAVMDQPAVQESETVTLNNEPSEERKEELITRYKELMASAPAKAKGKPPPELLAQLKEHSAVLKAWIQSLEDQVDRDFAETLRKKKGKEKQSK